MRERGIEPGERSGVLHPRNLARYGARWFAPDPAIADVVERYWAVEWNLPAGETIAQSIIAAPAVTLSLERGSVPAPLVVTGVYHRAWTRDITGSGTVLGIRLRPAGLAVLSDLTPERIADATLAVTPAMDARLHALLSQVSSSRTPDAQVARADALILQRLEDRPLPPLHRLANAVVDELGRRVHPIAGAELAREFGASERTVQRALKQTLGQGPKWVGRWVRLQEVVRLLSAAEPPAMSEVAVQLGYADQAHLVNDFRAAVGVAPGAYVRSLRELTGQ